MKNPKHEEINGIRGWAALAVMVFLCFDCVYCGGKTRRTIFGRALNGPRFFSHCPVMPCQWFVYFYYQHMALFIFGVALGKLGAERVFPLCHRVLPLRILAGLAVLTLP